MPADLGNTFKSSLAEAERRLKTITENTADLAIREGGWIRKEVLGHLIDSALNNHQRFVRAALHGNYEGPTYEQSAWVAIHAYRDLSWSELLNHWTYQNQLLARVVVCTPEDRLSAPCQIGQNPSVTLEFLILDYLDHLSHHLAQIC